MVGGYKTVVCLQRVPQRENFDNDKSLCAEKPGKAIGGVIV